ncbi:unnamed protein product [Vicia faba]|uniref:Protein kinase domain-containing protein n=1 Tax=Vicia faba TaxID=3906 RepID=A0AAV0YQR3_VICFA|nr:unnamed protein product [Vicia faba]
MQDESKSHQNHNHTYLVLHKVNWWHKGRCKLLSYYNSDNNKFLVCEYITNGSLIDTLNGKKSLLVWHLKSRSSIIIDVVMELTYLHHCCIVSIVPKHISSNKVLSGGFEEKVTNIGVSKTVTFASKWIEIMYMTMGSCGYVALLWRKEQKYNPYRNLKICTTTWISMFKQ